MQKTQAAIFSQPRVTRIINCVVALIIKPPAAAAAAAAATLSVVIVDTERVDEIGGGRLKRCRFEKSVLDLLVMKAGLNCTDNDCDASQQQSL